MKRYFIENGTCKLEVCDWEGEDPALTPVLFIPGMFGTAETFRNEIETNWKDRRCVSFSFRGRGQSGAPEQGYRLADHVSDIFAVVSQLNLMSGVVIVAHSRGVPYALGFTAAHPAAVKAIALLEHPPFHLPIEPEWVEKQCAEIKPGTPSEKVIRTLQHEADFVDLRGSLTGLTCPVLLVAGGRSGSMLTQEDLAEFSRGIKFSILHLEESSGHELETLQLKKLLTPVIQ